MRISAATPDPPAESTVSSLIPSEGWWTPAILLAACGIVILAGAIAVVSTLVSFFRN